MIILLHKARWTQIVSNSYPAIYNPNHSLPNESNESIWVLRKLIKWVYIKLIKLKSTRTHILLYTILTIPYQMSVMSRFEFNVNSSICLARKMKRLGKFSVKNELHDYQDILSLSYWMVELNRNLISWSLNSLHLYK